MSSEQNQKNKKCLSKKTISIIGGLALLVAISGGVFYALKANSYNLYEKGLRTQLEKSGFLPASGECGKFNEITACVFKDVQSARPGSDLQIETVKFINPDGLKTLFSDKSNAKFDFDIKLENIKKKDGSSILAKAFKDIALQYQLLGVMSPSEAEKFANFLQSEVNPLNLSINVSGDKIQNGDLANTNILFDVRAGSEINLALGVDNFSIDKLKEIKDIGELSRLSKFSKLYIAGKFPNKTANTMSEDMKKQEVDRFKSQLEVYSSIYGLDTNITKAITEKLKELLSDEIFTFKLSLVNKDRDDIELVLGSFAKAIMTGQLQLNNELLSPYKLELE